MGGKKLSVAAFQDCEEEESIKQFQEAEQADFRYMSGTANVAEHQITMKDDKPIKQESQNSRGN